MGSMSIVHWMIVIGVVVLLFGKGKISGVMGDFAQGMKSFKKGLQEDEPVEVSPHKIQTAPEILSNTENRDDGSTVTKREIADAPAAVSRPTNKHEALSSPRADPATP